MINNIKVNLEAVEALLVFWQAVNDRENMSELYIYDIAAMSGFSMVYDNEFSEESVRRALSAIKNREVFSRTNKKEGRFYNNNLWMMEDLSYTNIMMTPLKKLNLNSMIDVLNAKYPNTKYTELEVIFSPLHTEDYYIMDNKLIINFFIVKPSLMDDNTSIMEKDYKDYIQEKLEELLSK